MGLTKNQLHNLCYHFKIDPRHLTYVQELQMNYIHEYLLSRGLTIKEMPIELIRQQKQLKIRGRTRSLYHIFYTYKIETINSCGRYDTETWAVPITNTLYDNDD